MGSDYLANPQRYPVLARVQPRRAHRRPARPRVEAFINPSGEVYDYRILSGPTDALTRSQVENLLLFSRFAPARFFGQPVRGLAVLSFSGVSVRG